MVGWNAYIYIFSCLPLPLCCLSPHSNWQGREAAGNRKVLLQGHPSLPNLKEMVAEVRKWWWRKWWQQQWWWSEGSKKGWNLDIWPKSMAVAPCHSERLPTLLLPISFEQQEWEVQSLLGLVCLLDWKTRKEEVRHESTQKNAHGQIKNNKNALCSKVKESLKVRSWRSWQLVRHLHCTPLWKKSFVILLGGRPRSCKIIMSNLSDFDPVSGTDTNAASRDKIAFRKKVALEKCC